MSYLKPGNERRIDDCSYVEFIWPSSIINCCAAINIHLYIYLLLFEEICPNSAAVLAGCWQHYLAMGLYGAQAGRG